MELRVGKKYRLGRKIAAPGDTRQHDHWQEVDKVRVRETKTIQLLCDAIEFYMEDG
jgi:hypothetical protein